MEFQNAGVDQMIFLQQGGKNRHEHICDSLQYFARDVLPHFLEDRDAREACKQEPGAVHRGGHGPQAVPAAHDRRRSPSCRPRPSANRSTAKA
ncbi:MAG: hypothetical protein R2749_17255 [Acidimicrobiales bacterium]